METIWTAETITSLTTYVQIAKDISAHNFREIAMVAMMVNYMDSTFLFVKNLVWMDEEFIPRLVELDQEVNLLFNNLVGFYNSLTPIAHLANNLSVADITVRVDTFQTLCGHANELLSELLALDDRVDELAHLIPEDALKTFDRDVAKIKMIIEWLDRYIIDIRMARLDIVMGTVD